MSSDPPINGKCSTDLDSLSRLMWILQLAFQSSEQFQVAKFSNKIERQESKNKVGMNIV
jgi:hypothetical protein